MIVEIYNYGTIDSLCKNERNAIIYEGNTL